MRIVLNNKPYVIKFSYETVLYDSPLDIIQRITYAELFKVGEGKKLEPTGFDGYVTCDSRDRFVKETGRKGALTNLLKAMTEDEEYALTRKDRKLIWYWYFNRDMQQNLPNWEENFLKDFEETANDSTTTS